MAAVALRPDSKRLCLRSLRFPRSAQELRQRCEALLSSSPTEADVAARCSELTLPALVSPDAATREAATEAKAKLAKFFSDSVQSKVATLQAGKRRKLEAVAHADAGNTASKLSPYGVEKFGLVFPSIGDAGTSSAAETADKSEQLLADLCSQYEDRVNKRDEKLPFTKDELRGLPPSTLESLEEADAKETGGGRLLLPLKAPTRIPAMKHCLHERTRRRVYEVNNDACPENEAVLERILLARHDRAVRRGFSSHADARLAGQPSMAGSFQRVHEFTKTVIEGLTPQYRRDLRALDAFCKTELKPADGEDADLLGLVEDGSGGVRVTRPWNMTYAVTAYEEQKLAFEPERLRAHFPLEKTIFNILSMYVELLGFASVERVLDPDLFAHLWLPDEAPPSEEARKPQLYVYRVARRGDAPEQPQEQHSSYIMFDLFPRVGKYSHQCCYPLLPCTNEVAPSCLYIGNIQADGFLGPSEVQTLFHEIGHCFHCISAEVAHYRDSWSWAIVPWHGAHGLVGVEPDFLEIPSKMFEQWIEKRANVLVKVSDDANRLPLADAETFVRAGSCMRSIGEMRYWAMALVDLTFHSGTSGPLSAFRVDDAEEKCTKMSRSVGTICRDTLREVAGLETGGNFACTWYHMVHGYDASYYGYGWSEAYALDCFGKFALDAEKNASLQRAGIDAETGRRFREEVLKPCASRRGNDMMKEFLGREEVNLAGFLAQFEFDTSKL